jgi:hypothetical protein
LDRFLGFVELAGPSAERGGLSSSIISILHASLGWELPAALPDFDMRDAAR